jgi:hypothetical protein
MKFTVYGRLMIRDKGEREVTNRNKNCAAQSTVVETARTILITRGTAEER